MGGLGGYGPPGWRQTPHTQPPGSTRAGGRAAGGELAAPAWLPLFSLAPVGAKKAPGASPGGFSSFFRRYVRRADPRAGIERLAIAFYPSSLLVVVIVQQQVFFVLRAFHHNCRADLIDTI